jgi:hypothetical protein
MAHILKAMSLMFLFYLLSVHTVLCAQWGAVRFDEKGAFSIQIPGAPEVRGSLFLWHGEWKYAIPSGVESVGPSFWRGTMPEPGVTDGHISYTQTVKPTPDGGADIALAFHKDGEIHLTRGIFLLLQFQTPEMPERVIAFTHGPPSAVSDDYRIGARGFRINLSDSTALEFSLDRAGLFERRDDEGRASMNVRLSADADAKVNMHLRFKPASESVPSWQPGSQQSEPAIHGVKLGMSRVPRFHVVELTVDLSATYDNPFNPEDVAVDAMFITPSGRKMKLPGFLYQGFKAEYEDDLELLSRDGEPAWKVRFAPTEIGNYSVSVSVRDRSGTVTSEEKKFDCVESDSKGFLRISEPPEPGTPRYFQFGNGDTLFLIGHNMPTYSARVEEYFGKMEAGGENYNRFWMYRRALGLEWGQPVGTYRLAEAWHMDKALEAAARHGIYLMLCFDTHQDFRGEAWNLNPYNEKQGGPCEEPLDFFTNEDARTLYKKRLRYIVARWTAYTHVLAWEFMNEMEGWPGTQENRAVAVGWSEEMSKALRKLDSYERPISNSLWTTAGWPELWALPEMDFVQSHFYANSPKDMAQAVANICAQKRADYPDKLHVFAEYGIMSGRGTRQNDPSGVHLHNGNWAALMSGSASVSVSWWHESYIDPQGLYHVYRGLANFIADEKDLSRNAWKPLESTTVSYIQPPGRLTYSDLRFTGSADNWQKPEETVFTVREDETVENEGYLPSLLHGHTHDNLRIPLTFRVDFPIAGKFILHIGKVGDNGLLKFYLDGAEVSIVDLPTGEGLGSSSTYVDRWKRWETTYDMDAAVDVPAGRHEIQIQNDGRDWITVSYFRLTNYRTNVTPNLRVMGMQTSEEALIWVQNRDHTWFNVRDKVSIPPVVPTRLTLTGFADGEYNVELWDTVSGAVMESESSTAVGGRLIVSLPEVAHDIAVKVMLDAGY